MGCRYTALENLSVIISDVVDVFGELGPYRSVRKS